VFAVLLRVMLDVWPWPRAQPIGRRGPAARLPHLVMAAWLGCLGHVLLDVISGGTIRLFAPFSTEPYGVPWMAMADPLIAVPLAIFLLASWQWGQRGRQPERVRRFAWTVMIVLAAIVGVKEMSRRAAMDVYARVTDRKSGIEPPAIESAWGSFTRWFAFDSGDASRRVFEIDAWRGTMRPLFSRTFTPPPGAYTEELITASTHVEAVRRLHTMFNRTFVDFRPHRRDDGSSDPQLVDVLWSDIRFCWPADCALWFGGTFHRSTGALHEQVVLVGTLRQTRKP
jgi:hypothetical protein